MKRLVAITALALTITGAVPSGQQSAAGQPPKRRETVVDVMPVLTVTPVDWRTQSDALARVRIGSEAAFEDTQDVSSSIRTAVEAHVLDLLKSHPKSPGVGASMTIYEVGGTVERADGSMNTLLVNEPPLLRVGTEWVLFLRWHDRLNGFVIDHGHHGAFQIVAERIQPASRDEWLDSWRGRSLQAFLEGLKPFVRR